MEKGDIGWRKLVFFILALCDQQWITSSCIPVCSNISLKPILTLVEKLFWVVIMVSLCVSPELNKYKHMNAA